MSNTRTKQQERTLYIILAAALAARLLLALVTEGYTYDMSCFVAWGDKLASEGPAAFYSADYFADYPPGYILVLGLVSLVRKALQLSYESRWTYFLLALIPAICDCAAGPYQPPVYGAGQGTALPGAVCGVLPADLV